MLDENTKPEEEDSSDWEEPDILEEEIYEDVRDGGKSIDEYWAKGWLTNFTGFRRYNYDVYEERCYKVFPTRYRLEDFTLTKSLRRILKKNENLHAVIRPLRITEEKSKLYVDYYARRHNAQTGRESLAKKYDRIRFYPSALNELCIFDDYALIACSVFEVGDAAMHSNMAFWNLDEKRRGLGILTVLLEMRYGQALGLEYYYLGHYYKKDPNYQYKTRFGGLELYDWDGEKWLDFKNPAIESLLKQKLPICRY